MARQGNGRGDAASTRDDLIDGASVMPAGKLDADQYTVDDIDGVTESIFGSGAMSHASLQASQTDAALAANESAVLNDAGDLAGNAAGDAATRRVDPSSSGDQKRDEAGTDTDRPLDSAGDLSAGGVTGADGNFNTATVGSAGASQLSTDDGAFQSAGSGLSLSDALNVEEIDNAAADAPENASPGSGDNGEAQNDGGGQTPAAGGARPSGGDGDSAGSGPVFVEGFAGQNGLDGQGGPAGQGGADDQNGADGRDGIDGEDGETPEGPPVNGQGGVNIEADIDVDLGGDAVEQTVATLNTAISTLTSAVTETVNNLQDAVSDIDIEDPLEFSETTDAAVGAVENLSQNIVTILDDALGAAEGRTLTVDANVGGVVTASAEAPLGDIQDTDVDLGVDLAPVVETVENAANLTGLELLRDSLAEFGETKEALQTTIDQIADVISGLDGADPGQTAGDLERALDALDETLGAATETVNGAVGDVLDGLGAGPTADMLGDAASDAEAVVGDIAENAEAAANTGNGLLDDLAGSDADNDGGADSDVAAQSNVDGLDTDIADAAVEAVIDPVEDLAGDLDVAADAAIDLLGDNETDNSAGDSDLTAEADAGLVDHDVAALEADIPLDPVEGVVGDVDLDAGAAADVLGETADPVVNDGAGGTGEETVLDDAGETLEEFAEAVVPGLEGGENGESDLAADADLNAINEDVADAGADAVLDPVEAVAGDIDAAAGLEADLAGDNAADEQDGDADVAANIDADASDADAVDVEADSVIDPVEDITGDIDADIAGALDLLNDDAAEDADIAQSAGDDETSWTESTVADAGGLFDDVVNGDAGETDPLPEPVGGVAEGIGALDVEPDLSAGGMGGLFG